MLNLIMITDYDYQKITNTTRTPTFWGYTRCLLITHTIDSYWIPSQKETKSKLQIEIICQNFKLYNFDINFTRDTLKLLEKMFKYEIDSASIVEDREWTRFCPQMDRRTDGQKGRWLRWNQYTPYQLRNNDGDNNDNNDNQKMTKSLIIYFLSFQAVDDEEALKRKKTRTV